MYITLKYKINTGGLIMYNQNDRTSDIWKKTEDLTQKVVSLSEEIPSGNLYELKSRLINSVGLLPNNIDSFIKGRKKIDKIRAVIKANSNLNETRESLRLIKEMNYCDIDDLLKETEEITHFLSENIN